MNEGTLKDPLEILNDRLKAGKDVCLDEVLDAIGANHGDRRYEHLIVWEPGKDQVTIPEELKPLIK